MNAPPVQYVRTSDGYDIAYGVSGTGPPIVVLSFAFEHVQLSWQHPALGPWIRALAERFTVIQLDTRGSGLSTRQLSADFTLVHLQRDLEAVVEHLGLDGIIIWGIGASCTIGALYALDNPDRVKALILTAPPAHRPGQQLRAFMTDVPAQDWDLFLYSIVPRDRTPDEAKKQVELQKQSIEQETYVRRISASAEFDHVAVWERVITPTLVLYARDYAVIPAGPSIRAAQLARASLTMIDGSSVFGNEHQGIQAVEDFLSRLQVPRETSSAGLLSAREAEVLRILAMGKSNQQIADDLVISVNTVNRHVSNIYAKTGATNRAQAAVYAKDHGIA